MSAALDVAIDRPMPQAPEAERAVLGSILINNGAFYRVGTMLGVEDFYREGHQVIYAEMQHLANDRAEIDPLTLKVRLQASGKLEQIGGSAYVASLVDGIPDIAHVERYAEIVKRAAKLRKIIVTGNAMMREALDQENEPDEIAASALKSLSNVATVEAQQVKPLHEIIHESYIKLERRMNGESAGALSTGLQELDRHRAIRRTFGVIGCPSQHGKTAFMVNLAEALAMQGHTVAVFSLESTEEETSLRYVSTVGQVNHDRVQDWSLMSPDDFKRIAVAEKTARDRKIFLTRSIREVEGIYAECRRMKALHALDVVLVDYIQIVRTREKFRASETEQRLAYVSQTFLEMAIELGVGVYATSQLNEDRKNRGTGRLHQSDLKYARAIGESARVVLLFQRPHADDKTIDIPPCRVHFQVEKNNEGLTNDYEMHFAESTQTFREGGCDENRCHLSRRYVEPRKELFA